MSNSGPLLQLGSDGRLRIAAGGQRVLSAVETPCCCGTVPPADPCTSPPSSVAITGYFDGFFTPCPDGASAVPSDCVWPGIFWLVNGECAFSNYLCFNAHMIDGVNCYDCQMSGHRMWQLDPPGPSQITYDSATSVFTLQVSGQNSGGYGEIIWSGQKTGGLFTGTYTRTSGCDSHATLEVS